MTGLPYKIWRRYSGMQLKTGSILIIGMIILLAIMPASAYDYRGVPRPGDNNPDNMEEEMSQEVEDTGSEEPGLPGIEGTSDLESLIKVIIAFILQLFGISSS
jgi:hypothetical protein